jgi:hypothetical protein
MARWVRISVVMENPCHPELTPAYGGELAWGNNPATREDFEKFAEGITTGAAQRWPDAETLEVDPEDLEDLDEEALGEPNELISAISLFHPDSIHWQIEETEAPPS